MILNKRSVQTIIFLGKIKINRISPATILNGTGMSFILVQYLFNQYTGSYQTCSICLRLKFWLTLTSFSRSSQGWTQKCF